ncbi:hypothetical protein OG897_04325 [Streptomyces sp. NBC_00237]|uniref:hypothetical protein n=1 Tax=Streptomyces sp. NBC_00237 TaxID=2975687 RepID=UPI0022512C00|nr:hypothetical protein [Streptomyces sp. NBC_00237]MCX5200691.1 hypothetical protein [Streptomyces sp. NBC_00237]
MTPTPRSRRSPLAAAALLVSAALLATGCTLSGASDGPGSPGGDGQAVPAYYSRTTTIDATPPKAAAERGERFREDGGETYVRGIDSEATEEKVPRVIVWTDRADNLGEDFDAFKVTLVDYLRESEGFKAPEGYLLDMYGAKGNLLHRLDART